MSFPAPPGLSYLPYQTEGIRFAGSKRACIIGDEMGLGKTIQAIGIANADPSVEHILVVCPATLKLNWAREMSRWLLLPSEIGVVNGGQFPRGNVVVINYDLLAKHQDSILARRWDLLIVDEAHCLKNPAAVRTRVALFDRGGIKARRSVFLTGTPMQNRPIELWPLLTHVDPSAWKSMHEFGCRYGSGRLRVVKWGKDRNGRPIPKRQAWDYSGASNLDELRGRLQGLMIRRLKADVLADLPPKRRQVIEVGRAKRVIDRAALREAVALLAHDETQAAFTKLSGVRHEQALEKVPHMCQFLTEALESSHKIIVFAHHVDVIQALRDKLTSSGVKVCGVVGGMSDGAKQRNVDQFQNDVDTRVFLGNITAAGVGLTLTAASHVVFAELDWVPAKVLQAEDRAHRIGQINPVLVQYLVMEGSLDARIARALTHKLDIIDRALDYRGPPTITGPEWANALEEML